MVDDTQTADGGDWWDRNFGFQDADPSKPAPNLFDMLSGGDSSWMAPQQKQAGIGMGLLQAAGAMAQANQPRPAYMPRQSMGAILGAGAGGLAQGIGGMQDAAVKNRMAGYQMSKMNMDVAKEGVGMQQMLERANMQRSMIGLPPINLADFMKQYAPTAPAAPGVPSAAPPAGIPAPAPGQQAGPTMAAAQAPAPQTQPGAAPAAAPGGFDMTRLQAVARGAVPATPTDAMQLSTMQSYLGDEKGAAFWREYANKESGYRPGPTWNAPQQGIGDKDPAHIQIQEAAKQLLEPQADGSYGHAPGVLQAAQQKKAAEAWGGVPAAAAQAGQTAAAQAPFKDVAVRQGMTVILSAQEMQAKGIDPRSPPPGVKVIPMQGGGYALTAPDTAGDVSMAQGLAKDLSAYRSAAQAAQDANLQLQTMRGVMPHAMFGAGSWEGAQLNAARVANGTVGAFRESVPASEEFDKAASRLAFAQANQGEGGVTDAKLEQALRAVPHRGLSREGAGKLIEDIAAQNQRAIDKANAAQAWVQSKGSLDGFTQDFDMRYPPSAYVKESGAKVAPPVNAAPYADGATATNPQTGAKIIFRGGKWIPQ